jgi:hypothetical protein
MSMSARLSDLLVRDGALSVETVRVAVARQIVYGGALDTALLEMDALAEVTLWDELSHATGLPIPDPELVGLGWKDDLRDGFDVVRSERCRAVPVRRRADRLQLLCGDPVDRDALSELSAELQVDLELFVVPEARLKMARHLVYGQPIAPRFLRLLGRMLGVGALRRLTEASRRPQPAATATTAAAGTSAAATATSTALVPSNASTTDLVSLRPAAPVDDTEDLCRVAADPHAAGRIGALHALRDRLDSPRVRDLAAGFRAAAASAAPDHSLPAVVGISELRDRLAVPALIDLVASQDPDLAAAARQALVEITKQDFAAKRRRWRTWFDAHGEEARIEWLFAGLGHKVAEIRFAASEELWQITGEYSGYHYDQPKRERDQARARWHTWWRNSLPGR